MSYVLCRWLVGLWNAVFRQIMCKGQFMCQKWGFCEGGMRFSWNFGMVLFETVQGCYFRMSLFTSLDHLAEGS